MGLADRLYELVCAAEAEPGRWQFCPGKRDLLRGLFDLASFCDEVSAVARVLHRDGEPFPLLRIMDRNGYHRKAEFCSDVQDGAGRLHSELDLMRVGQLYMQGATLNLNQCERYYRPARILCGRMSTLLESPVQVNAYLVCGDRPGFNPHFDSHDVIVLQGHGRKRWLLAAESTGPSIDGVQPALDYEYVLDEGDILFVPTGLWHSVEAIGEPSLHFTVGIHAEAHAGSAVLTRHYDQLSFRDLILRNS
ncbi:JmjC domain-containing protein [Cupriavidus sp. TMH.W2]|uniref:JmjC domain-containing protein n=1 Tax=Cupriavidus sp. TMH.W2 TaxID=3434465 RepID=UPI003D777A85